MYGLCIKNGDYKNVMRFIADSDKTIIVDGEKITKTKFNSEFTTLGALLVKFKETSKIKRFSKRIVSTLPITTVDGGLNFINLKFDKGLNLTFGNYSKKTLVDKTWELLNSSEKIDELILDMGAAITTTTKLSKSTLKKFV